MRKALAFRLETAMWCCPKLSSLLVVASLMTMVGCIGDFKTDAELEAEIAAHQNGGLSLLPPSSSENVDKKDAGNGTDVAGAPGEDAGKNGPDSQGGAPDTDTSVPNKADVGLDTAAPLVSKILPVIPAEHCSNGVQDGGNSLVKETGIDCGGQECKGCKGGTPCSVTYIDCEGVCNNKVCKDGKYTHHNGAGDIWTDDVPVGFMNQAQAVRAQTMYGRWLEHPNAWQPMLISCGLGTTAVADGTYTYMWHFKGPYAGKVTNGDCDCTYKDCEVMAAWD